MNDAMKPTRRQGPARAPSERAALASMVVSAVWLGGGCASVAGHLEAGRLYEACALANDGAGPFEDQFEAVDAVYAAVSTSLRLDVSPMSTSELTALLGEAPREDVHLSVITITLSAPSSMVVHERAAAGALVDDDVLRALRNALPPLNDPPPVLLPPGPLVLPDPPDPSPQPTQGGGGRRRRGLIDAFVDLVTLPFTIVGAVTEALVRIPFDLFGTVVPRGTTTSNPKAATEPRIPGEAILPPDAFAAEKARLEAEHAAATAATAAARAARAERLTAVADRFRARCVIEDGTPCERLVIATGPVSLTVSVGLKNTQSTGHDGGDEGCGLSDITVQPSTSMAGWLVSSALPPPVDPYARPALKVPPARRVIHAIDVAALDDDAVNARLKGTASSATLIPEIACAVSVKPAWRRFLGAGAKAPPMTVRIAAGHDVGIGATLTPKAALKFSVGAALPVHVGDHVKVVVAGDNGYVGGVVGVFDGTLPIVLNGTSVQARCR